MSAQITITGNLAGDPELKYTAAGKAVIRFTVVTSRRKKEGEQWVDADTTFWNCSAWDQLAENIAESLGKGDPVVVSGTAAQRDWEQDGQKRSRIEVTAQHVGIDIKRHPAKSQRTERAKTSDDGWGSKASEDESFPF